MTAEGTAFGLPPGPAMPPPPVPIAPGTPMTIDLSFDSGTPNVCPPGTGGVYLIGGVSGNTATMHFLGYDYPAFGGIESGVLGPCGGSALVANLRLFVGGNAVQTDPNGIPINFFSSGFGNFFIGLPPPSQPGGLPTQLPTDPFSTFAIHFGDFNQLTLRSAEIRDVSAVPEPGTLLLTGIGGVLATFRRRRLMHSRAN